MATIHSSIGQLHEALRDYIEATYHISAESLIQQRRKLLDIPGVIHQVPYIESTPRYETGMRFSEMLGLPTAALEAIVSVSQESDEQPRLIHDPPYMHQFASLRGSLIERRNLVVMTGTGSGKTECFLLPILGKLAHEARERPSSFSNQPAIRALVLYPMNALVNDQLGRLRQLFGDPRLVSMFCNWSGRPARFARYTSRTPYAGVRTRQKDTRKFKEFEEFYVDIERQAKDPNSEDHQDSLRLMDSLKIHGKWPAKPDLSAWLGKKSTKWQDQSTGKFVRAVTLPKDSELLTRHEIQTMPPDLFVTNYSMLEYMMMRPIERGIFDRTRSFLENNPDEDFLIVLDEAHLYRGAAGAEVGLLLRRLRDRLNIPVDRFRVICATASFNDDKYAKEFGAQLTGLTSDTFDAIQGSLNLQNRDESGSNEDAELLASIDVESYEKATTDSDRSTVIQPLTTHLQTHSERAPSRALYDALRNFPPMGRLINRTMQEAIPVDELGPTLFPEASPKIAEEAVNALLVLGNSARSDSDHPSLLPCRIHSFFRGLAGLWICMDPGCTELLEGETDGICGKLFSQPRESCDCGARVLELYTCRNCGTAYARAYSENVDAPSLLWSEPGQIIRTTEGVTTQLSPVDLLLETPSSDEVAEPADYDIETGRLNPPTLGSRSRRVYLRSDRVAQAVDDEEDDIETTHESRGQFIPCAVCGGKSSWGKSYVQDHQTKGDQPFQSLVAKQLQIQPPTLRASSSFAPLRGRKVLTFSDSRQVAARLAPNLQMYSIRDSLRPLIAWGYRQLQSNSVLRDNLDLNDLYLSVLLAANTFDVRLRPELKPGESFGADLMVRNALRESSSNDANDLLGLYVQIRPERPPEALLEQIVVTVLDRFLGFEALAVASLVERRSLHALLHELPSISGIAESSETKVQLTRAWIRCWQRYGFWLAAMSPEWGTRKRSVGMNVRAHRGKFKSIKTVLREDSAIKLFDKHWTPKLLDLFTEEILGTRGRRRLLGSALSLNFDGPWVRCTTCKSVHRPVETIEHCQDCGSTDIEVLDPDIDSVFQARKGFYRNPVVKALADPPKPPIALVAAEHTAQLNAPQNEDVFSKAEENELLFQDISLGDRSDSSTAVDVLSSTTTMEVGIDIGALSGVALRNMPPSRANYQQRSGRAGRRSNAVATVVAFGSADSHDEHYFAKPDDMIRGDVIDPKLSLDNPDIARRHIRAFLLQVYHQDRITELDPEQNQDLFSVLGSVSSFLNKASILNRVDFASWLSRNEKWLRQRVSSWLPHQINEIDKDTLLNNLSKDCLSAIDDAISSDLNSNDTKDSASQLLLSEIPPEEGEENAQQNRAKGDKLLDRLLYSGKLPRYAFPTDVATFHVFDENSTGFRPVLRFAPQQGLPVALTQYAPSKQVWISGKCYASGAIYSVDRKARFAAWEKKRIYMECFICNFAKTYNVNEVQRNETRNCPACGGENTFGPGRYWLRPPGFAHPIDAEVVTSPDDIPETSYATRAKLTMDTPGDGEDWTVTNDRVRVLPLRKYLLVSNTGPKNDGYSYCNSCGRIEASTTRSSNLRGPHSRPYPEDDDKHDCDARSPTRHLVLGTDFITDIALFSLRVDQPLTLTPGYTSTTVALRTVSEALAKSACRLLELEPGELMAEFRPALTPTGILGQEAEVFLYDVLPGGAGFASQLPDLTEQLFHVALSLLENCEESCDSSCYRCLRSFKNKFEHAFLDRHVGAQLLRYLLDGQLPRFNPRRLASAAALLKNDLERLSTDGERFELNARIQTGTLDLNVPILAKNSDGRETVIALSTPLTPNVPSDVVVSDLLSTGEYPFLVENELVVRGNLPSVTHRILTELSKR